MGGGVGKVIFRSNPTVVLRLGWGFDNMKILLARKKVLLRGKQTWNYKVIYPLRWSYQPSQTYRPPPPISALIHCFKSNIEIPQEPQGVRISWWKSPSILNSQVHFLPAAVHFAAISVKILGEIEKTNWFLVMEQLYEQPCLFVCLKLCSIVELCRKQSTTGQVNPKASSKSHKTVILLWWYGVVVLLWLMVWWWYWW